MCWKETSAEKTGFGQTGRGQMLPEALALSLLTETYPQWLRDRECQVVWHDLSVDELGFVLITPCHKHECHAGLELCRA